MNDTILVRFQLEFLMPYHIARNARSNIWKEETNSSTALEFLVNEDIFVNEGNVIEIDAWVLMTNDLKNYFKID